MLQDTILDDQSIKKDRANKTFYQSGNYANVSNNKHNMSNQTLRINSPNNSSSINIDIVDIHTPKQFQR